MNEPDVKSNQGPIFESDIEITTTHPKQQQEFSTTIISGKIDSQKYLNEPFSFTDN